MIKNRMRATCLILSAVLVPFLPDHREKSVASLGRGSQEKSIKFAYSFADNERAVGVSVRTGNRIDIYGYSSEEGFKRLSYYVDGQGRKIIDSWHD